MARRSEKQRATDRLNMALARISAGADLVVEAPDSSNAQIIKQVKEAINDAYGALGDIRRIVGEL
jgi:hypothetical protein